MHGQGPRGSGSTHTQQPGPSIPLRTQNHVSQSLIGTSSCSRNTRCMVCGSAQPVACGGKEELRPASAGASPGGRGRRLLTLSPRLRPEAGFVDPGERHHHVLPRDALKDSVLISGGRPETPRPGTAPGLIERLSLPRWSWKTYLRKTILPFL